MNNEPDTATDTESLCGKCNKAYKKNHECPEPEIVEWVFVPPRGMG